jgi:periplasmic divalent cation tolerance protein
MGTTDVATGACLVFMTAPSAEAGEAIARTLVEERLAACGSIVPGMTSLYWWEGAVQRDAEVLVLFKTTAERVAALTQRAADLHPYDVPELLAVEVASGLGPYLDWIDASTDPGAAVPGEP